jgi:hypothetical protein
MSIINWFNKPKWKSKDENIRVLAVNSDESAELISQLVSISQTDESAKVRSAAVKRLDDYALIAKIANKDTDKSVKTAAYKILQDWFSKTTGDIQLEIIKTIEDLKTIEIVAANSSHKEVRQYCISKITKQGLLADLIASESDKDLRKQIAEKITKPATLKRVLKLLKNKDKDVVKEVHSRLENDDVQQIAYKKAIDLCEQMEKLIHNPSQASKVDVNTINKAWIELNNNNKIDSYKQRFEGAYRTASLTFDPEQREQFLNQQRSQRIVAKITELNNTLPTLKQAELKELQSQVSKYSTFDLTYATTEQKEEFNQLLAQLTKLRDAQSKELDLPKELIETADKLDKALGHKFNQPNQIKQFRKMWDQSSKKAPNNPEFNTLKNRFENSMLKLAEKVEASAALRDTAAKEAVEAIADVEKLIKDGHLADAKKAINKIAENKKIAGQHPLINENKFAFDTLWNKLKELRQWQTWSNDKIRIRLIEELKEHVGKAVHPDTLLKMMKESNKTWKDLEDHEKLDGDKYGVRNMELWNQFREVQKTLFEPAQPYFEKRSEIWNKELETVEAEIQALKTVDLEETEDRDLARMVRSAIAQLRGLDKVPPKVRGKCAAGLRAGMKRLDEHLSQSYEVAARRKEKLIERANELIELEELDSAIEQAKALQQEWKTAGIVNQAQERKLWKKFRKANDAVFNRIKQQRDQVKQENQQLLDQANKLITDCDTKIQAETTATAVNSLIENFKDDFNALNIQHKGLINHANKLIDSSVDKIASFASSENLKTFKSLAKASEICQQLELGKLDQDKAQEEWDKLKPIDDSKMTKLISKRFDNAKAGKVNENYLDTASTLLIAAEYLTGTATPEEYKEQRLAYQVEELSKRMSGEETKSESDNAADLLTQWHTLSGSDADFIRANEKRIKKIIKSLMELLE